MITKTVLYAICKNESKLVDEWLNCHKYFDSIYILDTGSTDDTIKKIKNHNVKVDTILYDRMNFSDAKNVAFEKAKAIFPNETCLYINLDIDEWLDELSFEKIRKPWTPDFDGIKLNRTTVQPGKLNIQDKIIRIHTGDSRWKWKHVLHESLEFDGEANLLESKYFFSHVPDMTKPRGYGKLAENWIRYFLQIDTNPDEVDRLLNTCLRNIYFEDKEDIDEDYILKIAEKRLLNE